MRFFDDFTDRTRTVPACASALYGVSLRHKVRSEAVGGIFHSMVDLSDNDGLIAEIHRFAVPRNFHARTS
ncbi:hypothetical protein [Burkholderia lata]|uniref:hypothetical protein n=1 Tax=Burkholderia lata (strain ATCC 17760 / DSM 23089 / LMG 22485 / NCIMB 9086 / R18194 / 383) TaxID=482957 RepID=UPI0020C70029|nr:hypothetical protein [Burkholderia lata]